MKNKLKTVFLGTPEFGIKPLQALIKESYQIVAVITAPDKPVGRKMILTSPPVKILAEKYNLPVFQPKDKDELLEIIKILKPDLAIVAAFGMIFTKEVLEIPKYGFLNIHPSLLPRWRGASPIQSAILAGDEKTGITIMLLNGGLDEGPILAQQELQPPIINYQLPKLQEELSKLGSELLVETIPKWINSEIKPQPQDNSKATYCQKIAKEDGLIDLNKESPEIIDRKVRAFTPWPGTYILIDNKRLIITQTEFENNTLEIRRVKPEGKKEMSFNDYLKGNPNKELEKFL